MLLYQSWDLKLSLYQFHQSKTHSYRQNRKSAMELCDWTHTGVGGKEFKIQVWKFCVGGKKLKVKSGNYVSVVENNLKFKSWNFVLVEKKLKVKSGNSVLVENKSLNWKFSEADNFKRSSSNILRHLWTLVMRLLNKKGCISHSTKNLTNSTKNQGVFEFLEVATVLEFHLHCVSRKKYVQYTISLVKHLQFSVSVNVFFSSS